MSVTTIPRSKIIVEPSLQPRVNGLDPDHVKALEEAVENWPPITVVQQGDTFLLIDGYHRVTAAAHLDLDTLMARIVPEPPDHDLPCPGLCAQSGARARAHAGR